MLANLHLQAVDLGSQEAILMIGGLGCLLQFIHLRFEIVEMLLFSLTECSLCRAILGFTFLMEAVRVGVMY